MATTGYDIFPGFTVRGVIAPCVQELAISFNLESLKALQMPVEADMAWADMCGVTPAVFKGKIPIDFTSLNGFEPFTGKRQYKQIEVAAIEADVNQWDRNLEWDIRIVNGVPMLQQIYDLGGYAQSMVAHARAMKARIAASVIMKGTPGINIAQVYAGNSIPGAGKSLFNTTHLSNPLDANSRQFSNYRAAVGPYSNTTHKLMRQHMRAVPSPALGWETLGLQVTDVIGPSLMEEPFDEVAKSNLYLKTVTSGGDIVGGAVTNIYANGSSPCTYWIAPQLDGDPYCVANPGKHMWITVSRRLPGARGIEMVAPSKEFTPRLQMFGDGSEMAAESRKVRLIGDLDAGAAAGLPHVIARYEET